MELPSLDSLIEGANHVPVEGETAKPAETKPPQQEEKLDRIEREQKHRREMFKAQERIKQLEEAEKLRNNSDKSNTINPESKNPIKDLAKMRNMSQDELVKFALEAMDDDLTPEEKKDEMKNMTPEQIAELVKKQLKEEREAEENKGRDEKAIADFKTNLNTQATKLADQYPLVSSLGGVDQAYALIEQKFLAEAKEFGEEYALENMMKPEEAIKKTNEALVTSVKQALKSEHLRRFLVDALKEEGGESEDQLHEDKRLQGKDVTLNNRDFAARTEPAVKPQFRSNEEELDFLIKKFI